MSPSLLRIGKRLNKPTLSAIDGAILFRIEKMSTPEVGAIEESLAYFSVLVTDC